MSDLCALSDQAVRDATVVWLERAVIGLNLCPFAKSVHVKHQIHYVISHATNTASLLDELRRELQDLAEADPEVRDTTLLVVPGMFDEFLEFNDFLGPADELLAELGLEGVLQIASFHPRFVFAGTMDDDITNCTNRSPFPTLHLIREASIDRAVQAFPQAEQIYQRNMELLQHMGQGGWDALWRDEPTPMAVAVSGDGDGQGKS